MRGNNFLSESLRCFFLKFDVIMKFEINEVKKNSGGKNCFALF